MVDIREAWEDRAGRMGSALGGVLFKGFTEEANAVLNAWHCRLVLEVLAPHIRQNGTLADIGCGFGRLSQVLAARRPDLNLVGQDISHRYCTRYLATGHQAVQADVASLPFGRARLAGAMAVTSLMYADRHEAGRVLEGIREALEPGAALLVVDPGEELRAIAGVLGGGRVTTSTGGRGFRRDEYRDLAVWAGFDVVEQGGNPRDSLLFATTVGGKLGWKFARRIVPRDGVTGGYSLFALHRWMLLKASIGTSIPVPRPS